MIYSKDSVRYMVELSDFLIMMLTVIGSAIAIHQWTGHLKRNRIDHFKMNLEAVRNHREGFSTKMREIYLRGQSNNESIEKDSYLLAKKDWIMDKLVDLNSLKVEVIDARDIHKVRRTDLICNRGKYGKLLPDLFCGYTENVRRYTSKNMFNGNAYRLLSITKKDDIVSVNVSESSYYSYYDTCEHLLYLAVNDISSSYNKRHGKEICRLNDPFDFDNRAVGIGISTLTIIKNSKEGNIFLIHKRSDRVAEGVNTVSAVPAGTFENMRNENGEISDIVLRNIVREFEEEILGVPEVENTDRYPINRVELSGFEFKFLGMGLDPLTTKLEIMTCLIIDAEKSELLKGTKDSRQRLAEIIAGSYEGSIHTVELTEENIKLHRDNKNSMPLFRDMMRIILKDHTIRSLMESKKADENQGSSEVF